MENCMKLYSLIIALLFLTYTPFVFNLWELDQYRATAAIAQQLTTLNEHLAKHAQEGSKVSVYNQGNSVCTSMEFIQGGIKVYTPDNNPNNILDPNVPKIPTKLSFLQRLKGYLGGLFTWKRSDPESPESFSFINYLQTNKTNLLIKALIAGYIWVNYRLFQLRTYLQDPQRWSFWKSNFSLSQLLELPQKDLAHELILDVRRRYGAESAHDITSLSTPITSFLQSLEEETNALEKYLMIANALIKIDTFEQQCVHALSGWIPKFYGFSLSFIISFIASKCAIKTFFYLDEKLMNSIQERLSKLAYLKNIFTHWVTEFKVRSARKSLALEPGTP